MIEVGAFALAYLYVAAAGLVCAVADQRGRHAFGWLCAAVLFSPLLAYLAVVAMPVIERDG